ncbi:MAG: SUMF1/EgtB/PvdO family nonheme iron enzyme [Pseudomonadota bacterium]
MSGVPKDQGSSPLAGTSHLPDGSASSTSSVGPYRPGMVAAKAPEEDDQAAVTPAQKPDEDLGETVRQITELVANGRNEPAREMVREVIRACDSGTGDVRDCSKWMKALQGLDALLQAPPKRIVSTNTLNMKLVRIPPGEYMMGSPKQEMDWLRLTFRKTWREGHKQWFQDEMPLHPVRITKAFYVGAHEVTVGQFREFVKAAKYKTDAEKGDGGMIFSAAESRWVPKKGMKWDSVSWTLADNQPVVFVSWNDAQAFCRWLSRKENRTYRLPTEAEWEMVCRGGRAWVRFAYGNRLPGDKDMNFGDGNSKLPSNLITVNDGHRYVAPVGSYPPNGFGVYDMDGNVMEWAEDQYDRNYYDSSPIDDPKGPSTGSGRLNKGGNWYASPADCRCAFRGFSGPDMSFWNLGFRVVMEEHSDDKPVVASKSESKKDADDKKATETEFPPTDEDGLRFFRQAMFAAQQQQWETAVEDLEKALKVYEKREDYKWIARVKATLAGVYAETNRRFKSKELFTQALAEFRKIGDVSSARMILSQLQQLETSPGVKVVEVKKGGSADKAGIVVGDTIVEYAGDTGFRVQGFKQLVNDNARMDKVTISILNNDEMSTLVVPGGSLGIALEDINRPPRPRRPPEGEEQRRRQRPQRRDRDRGR